jgi:methylmalonyl-CoA mutase C-terminal domain/subunit
MDDVVVFVGGIIPEEDIVELKKLGVSEVFTPGTSLQAIVEFVNARFADRVTAA